MAAIDAAKKARVARSRRQRFLRYRSLSLSLILVSYTSLLFSLTCVVLVHLLVRRHSPASPLLGTEDDGDDTITNTATATTAATRGRAVFVIPRRALSFSLLASLHFTCLSHERAETPRKCDINNNRSTLSRSLRSVRPGSGVPSLGTGRLSHVCVCVPCVPCVYAANATSPPLPFRHRRATIRPFPSFHSHRFLSTKLLLSSPFSSLRIPARERLFSTKRGFSSFLFLSSPAPFCSSEFVQIIMREVRSRVPDDFREICHLRPELYDNISV